MSGRKNRRERAPAAGDRRHGLDHTESGPAPSCLPPLQQRRRTWTLARRMLIKCWQRAKGLMMQPRRRGPRKRDGPLDEGSSNSFDQSIRTLSLDAAHEDVARAQTESVVELHAARFAGRRQDGGGRLHGGRLDGGRLRGGHIACKRINNLAKRGGAASMARAVAAASLVMRALQCGG